MTTKEKVIVGAIGLVVTGVMAYTIYDYDKTINENDQLKDYIRNNLKVEKNSKINTLIQNKKTTIIPKIIKSEIKDGFKVKTFENGMRVIEVCNAKEA